jgi:hypothetical protein
MLNHSVNLGLFQLLNYLIKFSFKHDMLPLFVLKIVVCRYDAQ